MVILKAVALTSCVGLVLHCEVCLNALLSGAGVLYGWLYEVSYLHGLGEKKLGSKSGMY